MAYESAHLGNSIAIPAHAPQQKPARDLGSIADEMFEQDTFEDDAPGIAPGWWIVPSVLCGGTMIASAVLML